MPFTKGDICIHTSTSTLEGNWTFKYSANVVALRPPRLRPRRVL